MRLMARERFFVNTSPSEFVKISEAQKNAILDISVDRVFLMDKNLRIIWTNRRCATDLDMPIEDMVGEFCYKVFHGRDYRCDICPAEMCLKSGEIEYAFVNLDDSETIETDIYWEKYAVPIKTESSNIVNIIQLSRNVTKPKTLEKKLGEVEKQIQIERRKSEQVRVALNVLLEKRNVDKREFQENVWCNVRDQVFPSLERLKKTNLDGIQRICLEILEANLHDLTTSFCRQMSYLPLCLTPGEMQVANLVKNGKSTKEIAQLLNLSVETINSHRKSIREKIGIKKKKRNLRTVLISRINGEINSPLTT